MDTWGDSTGGSTGGGDNNNGGGNSNPSNGGGGGSNDISDGIDDPYYPPATEGQWDTACGGIDVVPMDGPNTANVGFHNEMRRFHGLKDIAYDADLAADALAYARTRPNGHDSAELRRKGHGENIYMAWSSWDPNGDEWMNTPRASESWYDEEPMYSYSTG